LCLAVVVLVEEYLHTVNRQISSESVVCIGDDDVSLVFLEQTVEYNVILGIARIILTGC